MRNLILKHGDLVKYHIRNAELDAMGFVLGQFYEVNKVLLSVLAIASPNDMVLALVIDGELQDGASHFIKHSCPITLPKGNVS